MRYCEAIYKSVRFKTREVMVGGVGVGGNNPVRIQSMTTSSTADVDATIDQIIRLADHGCEIARVTVQGMKEAYACEKIKNGLIQKGYLIPLVADIHFYPPAAMQVVEYVDKVRINPGNFVDKRASFKVIEYDDASYRAELDRIEEKFAPLVEKCKKYRRSMRLGTNHGSLSDRIMNRYGDTPFGMVESAFEFTRICRKMDYHDIFFSMKASNPLVMIQAYRLLVAEMIKLSWDYPIHLGVTEAGLGEDGRVKSATGIGALLFDGIGDTIRVSLTEDPWDEIDPCKRLMRYSQAQLNQGIEPFEETTRNFVSLEKRKVQVPEGLHERGSVILDIPDLSQYDDKIPCDAIKTPLRPLTPLSVSVITPQDCIEISDDQEASWPLLLEHPSPLLFLTFKKNRVHQTRKFFEFLKIHAIQTPVILSFEYDCSYEDLLIQASAECGALFSDGLGEGICLRGPFAPNLLSSLSFNILQATRLRKTKTDFISCPGCGRTLFDLQEVTKKIKARTAHLPDVSIAIMGCIVNGPGEMADADFGYVGSKKGKIDLYIGKECVEKDIDFNEAEERLIELIKKQGRWRELHETITV